MQIEGDIERSRKDLIERPDFTLAGVFNAFTGYSQARIGANEFKSGLERLGVMCDIDEV
jgi:hypothetical protein